MAKRRTSNKKAGSPPFLRGGGGFEYEDRTAAYVLAAMLAEQPPFGEETCDVTKVDWQADTSGWRFDDLLVTCQAPAERRIAISCKAGGYMRAKGWPGESVTQIWEQWTAADSNPFQRSTDLLALVTGTLPLDTKRAWDRLLPEALFGDPQRFLKQYRTPRAASKAGRNLVASLKCSKTLVGKVSDEPGERFEVIRHLRLWVLDVLALDSEAVTRAVGWCRSALVSGNRAEAARVFQRLQSLAAERRPRSGSLTRRDLIQLLAAEFALKVAPSHEASWQRLDAHSAELRGDIRTTINEVVSFTHSDAWALVRKTASPGRVVLLEGESGSGKSALALRLIHGRRRVLWLSAADLEQATLVAAGTQLGVTVPLAAMVDEDRSADALLVIDSAERLTEAGRRTGAKLIAAALNAAKPWTVVVTTQDDGADTLMHEVVKAAPTVPPAQSVEVRLPDEQAVKGVVPALGVTISVKATPSLLRVLRNLKALDCVARGSHQKELKGFPDLVELVWSGLVGTENARARGEVLKRLGKEDAAVIVGGVPSSTLSGVGEQGVLEALIRDGLLSERRERLFFRHDLLGDWARLLTLIESDEKAPQLLKEVSGSIRWGSAIRLFAEWLLQEGEAERLRLTSFIVGEPLNPVSVALLEGLFRSTECGPVLAAVLDDQAWCTPGSLNALLTTFVSVATRPADICRVVSKTDPESAAIRSIYRTPIHELWPAVAGVMEQSAEQLARAVPKPLGEVARRWLADVPTVTREDLVTTHRACSVLAVAAARELQARIAESNHAHTEGLEHAFEAVLYAAPWLPDEVAALALELSGRKEAPQAAKDRAAAMQRRLSEEIKARWEKLTPEERKRRQGSLSIGPMPPRRRKQMPGGPAHQISKDFRKAVFAGGVLVRLMAARPGAAQEALLACCLEDPSDEDPLYSDHYHGDHTGTVDQMGWHPPLYLRGPWLALLAHVPEQGIEAIVRLVEVGTAEWLRIHIPPADHPRHDWEVRFSTITLRIGDADRVFRGDNQVFGWYRGYGRSGKIVASALMALESWLYALLEAKQPVHWVTKRLFEASTSVAVLGVLAALARKRHQLLNEECRPLVQSWMLLYWDGQIITQDQMSAFDPLGLKALNNRYDDEAERWSALEHRKLSLPFVIAQKLALGHTHVIDACRAARTSWQAEVDAGTCLDPDTVQQLVALLDPGNLSIVKDQSGRARLSVRWPPALQAKHDEQDKRESTGRTAVQLCESVRQLLDDPRPLTDEEAELLWNEASALPNAEPGASDRMAPIVDARAAAAAALENHASGWLDRFSDRRAWSEAAAIAATQGRDKLESDVGGIAMFKKFGESFSGAWGIARLAAGDDRPVVRRVVAEAMTASEYIVAGQLLGAAVRLAAKMPAVLEQLFGLMWLWAALRNLPSDRWDRESWEARISASRRQRLIDAYAENRVPKTPIAWENLKLRAARVTERHQRRSRAKAPSWLEEPATPAEPPPMPLTWEQFHNHGFNWSLLEKVVEGVPYVLRPSLGPDLGPLIEFDRRLLDLVVWNMKQGSRRRRDSSDSLPEMLDRLTLDRAAAMIAGHEDEAVALGIWKTLAPQLAFHHYWVETFFDSWFSYGRKDAERAKQFHRRWRLMLDHTDTLEEWKKSEGGKWYDLQRARSAILGVHERGSKLGAAEDRPFLAGMVDRYRAWAQEYAADPWRLRSFCYFLQKAGAVDLRLPALRWVRDALKALAEHRATNKELVAEVVALCVAAWYQHSQAVLANPEARSTLIEIVQHLSQLQVQEIKELKADLEAAVAQSPADTAELRKAISE